MDQFAADNWLETLKLDLPEIHTGDSLARYLEQQMVTLRQFLESPAAAWHHHAVHGLHQAISEDWIRTLSMDFPGVVTGDQLAKTVEAIGLTPERFLSLPASMADDPAIHDLRKQVWSMRMAERSLQDRKLLPAVWRGDPPWPVGELPNHDELRNRYRGCLIGGAIGDALGRPGEGRTPETIADLYGELRDFVTWPGWDSGPRGTITDDTQLTMEVARTYLDRERLDPADLGRRIGEWLDYGRGKGRTCVDAAIHLREGVPWYEAGIDSAGNGAAMRAAPVGLVNASNMESLRRDAALSTIPTHSDGMAVASSVVVAFSVAYLLRKPVGSLDPQVFLNALVQAVRGVWDPGHPERRPADNDRPVTLARRISDLNDMLDLSWREAMDRTYNGAFVLESLPAALWFTLVYCEDPEEALVRAASAGYDADTVAAMTGNMLGAYHGLEALPARWRNDLEYCDELESMADGLLDLASSRASAGGDS